MKNYHFRKTAVIIVVEAGQSGGCLRAEAQPISGDYGQKYVSLKHEMWLARRNTARRRTEVGGWVGGGRRSAVAPCAVRGLLGYEQQCMVVLCSAW
jgi:hypothetical protein